MANSESPHTSSSDEIQKAVEKLRAGHLVAFPTETVYGLGADATNEEAIKRVYEVKGRPKNHPLILHISSINRIDVWAKEIPDYAMDLARTFWPGPLTLILKKQKIAKNYITGSQESVGIRVPNNPIALELLTRFEACGGLGIAAPSANRFGQVSPTSASDVYEELGQFLGLEDSILDGGKAQVGIESTIIDCTYDYPQVLRPGAVTRSDMDKVIGTNKIDFRIDNSTKASGMFASHYAPKARVLINKEPVMGQGLIALYQFPTPPGVVRVGSPEDVFDYARELYSALRRADSLKLKEIVVFPPDGEGLAEAITERILKAAGGREIG